MVCMQEKLVLRMDQQDQSKGVSNELVGQAKESIAALNQNMLKRQKTADHQQIQMNALTEQTKKLIVQCSDSSKDLGNQQNISPQEFVKMKQRQSDAEQEISAGIACQKDLANHTKGGTIRKSIHKRRIAIHAGSKSKPGTNPACSWRPIICTWRRGRRDWRRT